MTMPYYASAEQVMRDRSEYARKGISRGRSVAVLTYVDGVLFIAENPSSTLHKVDQLYRLTFDGSIVDEPDFVVMGGQADAVTSHLRQHFTEGMGLAEALKVGVRALSAVSPATSANGGGHQQLPA